MRQALVVLACALTGAAGCLGEDGVSGSGRADMPLAASHPASPVHAVSPRPAAPLRSVSPAAATPASAASAATADPTVLADLDWSRTPLGGEPDSLRDPAKGPGDHPYWLASGHWAVVKVATPAYTGLAYQPSEERPQPWLSFRVLDQVEMPNRYRVSATVQPVGSPVFKAPVGEISVIPYYRDPTHYLEVLITNERLEVWLADGAEPDTDRGWTGIHFLPLRTRIGDLRTVTIDVDLDERRLTASAGDQTYTLNHAFLDPTVRHRVAVRSAGNTFNLLRFRVAG
jgi:hypothetical protein